MIIPSHPTNPDQFKNQTESLKEKYLSFLYMGREITDAVFKTKSIPFKIKGKDLVIANKYTPYEVKKVLIFCMLVTAPNLNDRIQCLQKITALDKRVASFNKKENINPVNTKKLDPLKISKEIKSFLEELSLDPNQSHIDLEFSILPYRFCGYI